MSYINSNRRLKPHIDQLSGKFKLYFNFGLQVANWQFDYIRWRSNYKIVHCLGDSHTHFFEDIRRRKVLHRTILRTVKVGGATAMGITNSDSATNALKIYQRYIPFIKKNNYILFMLGEVDCGFLIWYRAAKYNLSVGSQLQRSIDNYQNFILDLIKRGYHNLILSSAPLPAILDRQDWGEFEETQGVTDTFTQRQGIQKTLRERTDLTIQFNDKLRILCLENNLTFLDFEQDIMNSTTNLIDNQYRQINPTDNHLKTDTVLPIIVTRLKNLGFE